MTSRTALFALAALLTLSGCATPSNSSSAPDDQPVVQPDEEASSKETKSQAPEEDVPAASVGHDMPGLPPIEAGQRQPLPKNPGNANLAVAAEGVDLRRLPDVKFDFRNLPEAGLYYITAADQWPVAETLPQVDFDKYDVLLVVEGSGSSQRRINIQDSFQTGDTVFVNVVLTGPGDGCKMTRDLVPTFDVARMPKTDKKVRFQVASERQDCES